ncbi:PhoH-like ATPase [Hydrogenispora ethanolica]|uniref:PhoH-like ATPase n=1 Tax=Hydrogenispora ethanolica TaxID=1082276 RepID=A0A4R1RU63_HYDET|nr:PhoH family protein [Hydrogenispora ethanolica]TCL69939.1 PhoH-like ATPase [Hydrogenispora ethanolica]
MKKIFVLDTSILLHDPQAFNAFQDNDIVIPLAVVEEIDGQKKRQDEVGRNARRVSAFLDRLRENGHLDTGVPLGEGRGTIRVELNHQLIEMLPPALDRTKTDNRIIAVALALKQSSENPVVLISKDINMRIKADAVGIAAADYETDKIEIEDVYTGIRSLKVPPEQIDRFYAGGELTLEIEGIYPNQMIILEDSFGSSKSALARHLSGGRMVPLRFGQQETFGLKARNKEQKYALELLLDDEVRLVTLIGRAGTGKTLLALAAGLQKVVEESKYRRLAVSRPVIPMGSDLGFLPGDVNEKLRPWMQPIYDNLEFLFNNRDRNEKIDQLVNSMKDLNLLEMEALTYIRGRSIPNQFLLVDEAQNLSPHEIRTVITRVGEGTKIVLTGDPYQIDHPYLDSNSNGLTFVVERFKNEKIAGHITLTKGERSDLAELGAKLLG